MLRGGSKVPLPWDIIVFVTITTVGFGFSVKRMSLDVKTSDEIQQTQEFVQISASNTQELNRSNASFHQGSSNTIDLGCLERKLSKQRISAENGVIRIKGKLCNVSREAMKEFKGLSVINLTTGYEGTIFFQSSNTAFITDFLVLKRGRNDVKVEWKELGNSSSNAFLAEVFSR